MTRDELREQIRKVLKNNLVVVMGDIPPPTRAELDSLSAQLEPLTQRIALEARINETAMVCDLLHTKDVQEMFELADERLGKLKRELQELDK